MLWTIIVWINSYNETRFSIPFITRPLYFILISIMKLYYFTFFTSSPDLLYGTEFKIGSIDFFNDWVYFTIIFSSSDISSAEFPFFKRFFNFFVSDKRSFLFFILTGLDV